MRPAALNRRARGWLLAVMIGIAVVAAGRCASKTAVVRMDADGGALSTWATRSTRVAERSCSA